MRHRDGFLSGVRNTRIYHQCWLPGGESTAAVLLVHGLAEHSGRYANLVNRLVPGGYAVYGLDHIGHGRSGGTRVYAKRFAEFTETLHRHADRVRDWQPGKPIFLYGHSVGALIASVFLFDHPSDLAGTILSGPCVTVPANVSATTVFLAKALSHLLPKLGLAAVDASGVSRDPAAVRAYVDDPLVYCGKTTARLSCELLKAMQRVLTEAHKITLPILIVQGGADRIVDPGGARMLHEAVGSADKTLKIYDGLYHELHNEPERDQVLADIIAWLDAHVGPSASRVTRD